MQKINRYKLLMLLLLAFSLIGCNYEEGLEMCQVHIKPVFPAEISSKSGFPIELIDTKSSVFISNTDDKGSATFSVPPGLYEARASYVKVTTDYRYFFNGVKSMIIVSPDSVNTVQLKLSMSKKRIVK